MNSLEREKQDLELNSLYNGQPVKLSQCRSYSIWQNLLRSRAVPGAVFCTLCIILKLLL